jgi:eukaryotic-like serine/threonine-protein kinase
VRRLDRAGRPVDNVPLDQTTYRRWARLSPDGASIAYARVLPQALADIWVMDLRRGIRTRVTSAASSEHDPIWSPDGRRLVFQSTREADGRTELYERDAAALSPARLLVTAEPGHQVFAEGWSPDGRTLLMRDVHPVSGRVDLLSYSPGQTPLLTPYVADGFVNRQAAFSPDGRWVAYATNQTGQLQVVLRSFPDPTLARIPVSADGGAFPRWRADGRELFYLDGRNRVIAVPVTPGPSPTLGTPVELFTFPTTVALNGGVGVGAPFDVFPDGQHFIAVTPRQFESGVSLTVTTNWTAGLRK